jgi:hypothetical protein
MKFIFSAEIPKEETTQPFKTVLEVEADHIGDVVENFELFLRGVGFHEGSIQELLYHQEPKDPYEFLSEGA